MNRIIWTKKKSVISLTLCAIIAVSSIMILQNNQTTQAAIINPHAGLVGWWRFDEGTGATVAGDSSGNGNNGAINGATSVAGEYGNALSFDGTNDYVNFGDIMRFQTGDFSVSFWVKYVSGSWAIITKGWAFHGTNGWGIACEGGGVSVALQGRVGIPTNAPLPTNQWTLVTVTFNRTSVGKVYLNGVQKDSFSISSKQTISGTTDPLYVGRYVNAMDFNGIIDEVRVYNRTLSAAEIQGDFNEGPDFSGGVVAKVPQGTTQVIATLSWQGSGNINVTIQSPAQNYTESMLPEYQKTSYSTSGGSPSMLNIKRLSVSVSALASDQNWYIMLTLDNVDAYQITVEVQK